MLLFMLSFAIVVFSRKNLFAPFLSIILAIILVSVAMRNIPFARVLVGLHSILLAMLIVAIVSVCEYVRGKKWIWLKRTAVVAVAALLIIAYLPVGLYHLSEPLYHKDTNVYHKHIEKAFVGIPKTENIACSDQAFILYYEGLKRGYKMHKTCDAQNAKWYVQCKWEQPRTDCDLCTTYNEFLWFTCQKK
jgi:hypothetical protein